MGNEMAWSWNYNGNTLWNNTAYNDKHNRYIDYIRRYTISKWNRFIPITTAAVNIVSAFNLQYSYWHVDIFSSNVFGTNFDYLFEGYNDGSFYGVSYLQCAYNKPFLYTELYSTAAEGEGYVTGTFNEIWYQVWRDIQAGLIGAVWFEQTDELALGKDSGFFALTVAGNRTQNSTSPNVIIPDNLAMKQQYVDAYEGSYEGYAFNMNENMFTLLGRNPYNINNAPNMCSQYQLASCPGTTLPYCSGNGACDRTKGVCDCATGWSGQDCSVPVCPNSCRGNGVCSSLVTPPECVCNNGYYNTSCEVPVSSVARGSCPNGCTNGNGVCTNNITGAWICACWPGWAGPDCSVTDLGTGSISAQQYYLGCYSASNSVNFAVTAPTITALTNQKCRYYCALRNYTYSATESGTTCLCDNTLRTSNGPSTSCTTACSGDSLQACGGRLQNSVYLSGGPLLSGYQGCYIDNSGSRDLPTQLYSGAANTVDSCRKLCGTNGYLYAGLQSGSSCFCGNTFGNEGGKVSDSQCSTRCSGDASVNCGATLRNSIYTTTLAVGYNFP